MPKISPLKQSSKGLEENLIFLLDLPYSISHLKSNRDYQNLMLNEIYAYETLIKKTKTSKHHLKSIVDKFNSVSLTKYESKGTKTFKTNDELIDFATYLKIYVKNILKIDLDTCKNNSNSIKEVQTVEPIQQNVSQMNEQLMGMNFNEMFNNQSSPNSPTITILNPEIQRQAHKNLQERIIKEDIYIFNSKPKHIPLSKLIYTISVVCYALMLIAYGIVLLLLNGKGTGFNDTEGNPIIFYTNFKAILAIVLAFVFFNMGAWMYIKDWINVRKYRKTLIQNTKYGIITWYVGVTVVFALMYCIYLLWPQGGIGATIFEYLKVANEKTYANILALEIIVSFGLFLTLSITVFGIILSTTAPKINLAKLQGLMIEEMNKITSNNPVNN